MDKWGKKKPGKSPKSKAEAQKVTWTKNASNEKAMRLHRNRKKVALVVQFRLLFILSHHGFNDGIYLLSQELWDTEKR